MTEIHSTYTYYTIYFLQSILFLQEKKMIGDKNMCLHERDVCLKISKLK